MSRDALYVQLKCRHCGWLQLCGASDVAVRLRSWGMLRSNSEASVAEMHELLRAAAVRQTCPQCSHKGLWVDKSDDDQQEWPTARRCEVCGKLIDPERLEVFPDAVRCTSCERRDEQGLTPVEHEYCPRCGSLMVLKQTRSGITRYELVCSSGPRCHGNRG